MAVSSALLRPLFTLTFIELINKAPGSAAVFTAPLLLLMTFITVLQTEVALGTPDSGFTERLSQHVEKKSLQTISTDLIPFIKWN